MLELVIVSVVTVSVSGRMIGSRGVVGSLSTGPTIVTLCATDDSFVNLTATFPGFAKKIGRRNLGPPSGSAFISNVWLGGVLSSDSPP